MIYITGDMHGEYQRFEMKKLRRLTEKDTLIVCGDFGFIWDGSQREQQVLRKIAEKKYRILFVEGTHENYSLLATYPITELFGGRARRIGRNIFQLLRGEIYTIEEKTFFAFGGGESEDKDDRREQGMWWQEEMPSVIEMQYAVEQLDKVSRRVDYIITHQPCPKDMALVCHRCHLNPLTTFFDELSQRVTYRKWFFGSLHKNKKLRHAYSLFTDVAVIKP